MTSESIADVSIVILTYNEEVNIGAALRSVCSWTKEVFVVDSGSTDRTADIARSFPGVRVVQHAFDSYGAQWDWALNHLPLTACWVMKLDADEWVSDSLREEIVRLTRDADCRHSGYYMRFRLRFDNQWLRFGGFHRTWILRLWRRDSGQSDKRPVNEHVVVHGTVGRLRSYFMHDDRKGISAWLRRHNYYSTEEAREAVGGTQLELTGPAGRRKWFKRHVWPYVPWKPLFYFAYVYFVRLGILDGRAGFRYACLRSFYYYLIELKKSEMRSVESNEANGPPRNLAFRDLSLPVASV